MRIFTIMVVVIMVMLLFCSCAPSRVEMDFGASYQLAKYNQVQNPSAEKNLKPVEGMDGVAADAVVENYRNGFETPAPAQPFTLSVGTSGGN